MLKTPLTCTDNRWKSGVEIGTVDSIWRYPVRSLGGEEIAAADVTERGLVGDRGYSILDRSANELVGVPASAKRWAPLVALAATYAEAPRAGKAPPPVRIRFPDGRVLESKDAELDECLSAHAGRPAGLVVIDPSSRGAALEKAALAPETGLRQPYAFGAVHAITTASLAEMRHRHPEGGFEIARFRPNVVIKTNEERGFVENEWNGRELAIGESLRLRVSELCERCVMTTLPHQGIAHDVNILKTINGQNRGILGVRAEVVAPGTLRRGDPVTLF